MPVLGRRQLDLLGLLHQRADPVDLLAFADRVGNPPDQLVQPIERQRHGADRPAASRLLRQPRDIHVAEGGQHQRARDRRRRHHQHVRGVALGGDRQPLVHAEAMLLVDHGKHEVAERHLFLEQRMRADHDVNRSVFQPGQRRAALAALLAAGQDRHPQSCALGQRRDRGEMLPGKDFGRRHQRRLSAGLDRARHGKQRHHGLAGADVALQQPAACARAPRGRR